MDNKQELNQSTLKLKLIAQVNGPFIAAIDFEMVELDTSRLRTATLNKMKSLSIRHTVTADGSDEALLIEATCECEVNKNGKAYREYIAKRSYGGPLGYHKFDALKRTTINLTADLIKYLGWRKGISLHYDKIDRIEVRWRWEMDDVFGDDTTDRSEWNFTGIYKGTYIHKLQVSPTDFEDFYSLQEELQPKAIPLHQELMMEVDRLMRVNPSQMENNSRSAYLIMYVALEVATKSLIKSWNKAASWLIDNMPSPDLYKMYGDFIRLVATA